jgi:hypothetical protein
MGRTTASASPDESNKTISTVSSSRTSIPKSNIPSKQLNLKIFAANFRSLNNKIFNLQCKLSELNIDLFIGCETWLTNEVPNNFLTNNYSIFRKDRTSLRGGGVIIGIKKQYKSISKMELNMNEIELIWVEIRMKNTKFLCGAAYRQPNEP